MRVSFAELYRHYVNCRRNKRNTVNALRFEVRQELALLELRDELNSRRYRPGRSVCFVTRKPKLREIFAADFRDRIVHHLVVDHLEAYWERVFIHDSYACRKGKGVHAAVDRLQRFLRQVTRSGKRSAWYLQLDIQNYFMRIDKARLWAMLEPHIDDDYMRGLTRTLVFHDCAADYVARGPSALLDRVPPHKSLRHTEPGRGLPIGNLNSQFFANVYLNGLDQFVKHDLKCRHYPRYCDDFVLLSERREQLQEWQARIASYLDESLGLVLNAPRTRLQPVGSGIDFLGYIVRHDYRLVRRRVVGNLFDCLNRFARRFVFETDGITRVMFNRSALERLHAVLTSYHGHFLHADAYGLWQSLARRFGFLYWLFRHDPATQKLLPRYGVPAAAQRVSTQYLAIRAAYPEAVVFFQVGRYIEFYAASGDAVCERMGLRRMHSNRRGARYGFPLDRAARCTRRLLDEGVPVVRVVESERPNTSRIKSREIGWLDYRSVA